MKIVRHWNRLAREVVDAPSLKCPGPGWVGFWESWSGEKCSCLWQGGSAGWSLKVLSDPNDSVVIGSANFCSWKSQDWAIVCLFRWLFKKEASSSHLLTLQESSWARMAQDRTKWKSECCLSVLGAPVVSHAKTSHYWFPLQTNKQTRKEVKKDTHLPHTTDTFGAVPCWAGPAHPLPSCLGAASPHGDGSCVLRDATSWQWRAVTQPLKSWCAHSPGLCWCRCRGEWAGKREGGILTLGSHSKGRKGWVITGLKRSSQFPAQKED